MRRANRHKRRIVSEINMTPLIDVMMCLLVIFMITAPLLTSGIPLNLPRGDGKSVDSADKTLDINIDKTGTVFIGNKSVKPEQFLKNVTAIVRENPRIRIMISGDKDAPYGQVIETMALLRAAGFSSVALKTDAKSVINQTK